MTSGNFAVGKQAMLNSYNPDLAKCRRHWA